MDEKQFTEKFLEMTPTYGTMIWTAKGPWTPDGYSVNMSGIDSYLIQNIGRFVENYNSDYLITREHVQNNRSVREMLGQRGIKPEELPPAEDIKKLERRVKSQTKKLATQSGTLPDPDKEEE